MKLLDVAALSAGNRFLAGIRFAASGVPGTLSHPKLLGLAAIPIAVQTAIYVAIVWAGLSFHARLVEALGPDEGHWYSFLRVVVGVLLVALIAAVGLLLTMFIGSVVCDPFYDALSEQAEVRWAGKSGGTPFTWAGVVPGILREALATVVRLGIYIPVALLIWSLNLVPVVGQVLSAPLALAWTWLFVCYEVLARSLARHGMPIGQRLKVLFAHKVLAMGFGAGAWLMLFLPFCAPFCVVGGTRMYLALAAHGRVPTRFDDDARKVLRELA